VDDFVMKSSPLKHEYDKLEERHEMYYDEIRKMKKEY
jgi:hypothetical protein